MAGEIWTGKWKTFESIFLIDFRPYTVFCCYTWIERTGHYITSEEISISGKNIRYPENMVAIEKPSIWCDENGTMAATEWKAKSESH